MESGNRSRRVRLISVILTLAIFIGVFPIKHVKADTGSTTENNLTVTYHTVSAWGGFTQAEVTVENIGNTSTENWQIEFEYDDTTSISSIWNAIAAPSDISSPEKITVSNESYNGTIAPNESITFGLIVQGEMNEIPDIHVIPQPETPVENIQSTLFPYAIFSNTGFVFQGWKSTVSGDVYTGNNFDYQGSELNLYGNLDAVGTVNANGYLINIGKRNEGATPTVAPDFSDAIEALSSRMTPVDASAFTSQDQIVANGYYSTNGSLTISGTQFSGDCVIVADGDITYNVDSLSGDGRVVLYSKHGNVTINGSQITFNGIIYAPNGAVSINAYDTTYNGRIIANQFKYNGSIFNVTVSAGDLELLYDLPVFHITAEPTQIEIGESSEFTIVCEDEETPYEVKFRLNGEEVEISEDLTYALTPDKAGEFTLEAFVESTTGEVVLDQATVIVTIPATPTPVATETPTPTEEPTPTVTETPYPTDTPEPTVTTFPDPTNTPTPTSEPTPTNTATPTPTSAPNSTDTPTPTPTPTGIPLTEQERYFILSMGNSDYGYQNPYVASEWNNSYIYLYPDLMNISYKRALIDSCAHYKGLREIGPNYDFCGRYTFSVDYDGDPANSTALVFSPDYIVSDKFESKSRSLAIHIDVSQSKDHTWYDPFGKVQYGPGTEPYPSMISICLNGDGMNDRCLASYPLFLDRTKIHEIWYEYDGTDKLFYVYVATYNENGNVERPDVPTLICPVDMEEIFEGEHQVYISIFGDTALFETAAFLYHGIEFDPYPDIHERHNSSIEIVRPKQNAKIAVDSSFEVFGRINAETENVYISVYNLENEQMYSNSVPTASTYTTFDEISTQGWAEGTYILKVAIDDGSEKTILFDVTQDPILERDVSAVSLSSAGMDIIGTVNCSVDSTYNLHFHVPEHDDWYYIGSGEGNKIDEVLGNLPFSQVPKDHIQIKLTVTLESGEVESVIRDFEYDIDPYLNPTSTPTPTGTPTPIPGDFTDDELFVDVDNEQEGMEVSFITEIVGTVSGTLLDHYVFEVYPADSDVAVYTSAGTSEVIGEALGTLDATLLVNGYYLVKVTAYAADGRGLYDEVTVLVCGNAKIGNYSISFNDLSTGLNNFPIQIYRTYDSRRRNELGDFGYGWEMTIGGPEISISGDLASGWSYEYRTTVAIPLNYWKPEHAHEIYIDWGNGHSETFELSLTPEKWIDAPMGTVSASFTNKSGKSDKLTILDECEGLSYDKPTKTILDSSYSTWNPQNFLLTTRDGVKYYFSLENGLYKVEDTYGRTIEITDEGVFYSDGSGIEFVRDEEGRITAISDSTQSVSYSYENGDLTAVVDRANNTTSFKYKTDPAHYLEEIIDPLGHHVSKNYYDDDGRLIATEDASGHRITFEHVLDTDNKYEVVTNRLGYSTVYFYDDYGNTVSVTDPLGREIKNEYDSNNNLKSSTDAMGNTEYFTYSADGDLILYTNKKGVESQNIYSSKGELVQTNSAKAELLFTYGPGGEIKQIKDALGNTETYTYSTSGRLTGIADSIGMVVDIVYADDGRVLSMKDTDGIITSFTYDKIGNPITCTVEYGEDSLTSHYFYNAYDQVVRVEYYDGEEMSFSYDSVGNLISKTDNWNNTTKYFYDDVGNLEHIEYPDSTSEDFTYDAEGNVLSCTDRYGNTARYEYNAVGKMVKLTESNGNVSIISYDDCDRVVCVSVNGVKTFECEYDAMGHSIKQTNASGASTCYDYGSSGYIEKAIDANGKEYLYEHDKNGNCTALIAPDGCITTWEYDERGRLVSEKNAHGNTTYYAYNENDRLTSVTDAQGSIWRYSYDDLGNITCMTDALGNTTCYSYDEFGRLISVENASGKQFSCEYTNNQLTTITDYKGNSTSFEYDSFGRIVQETSEDGSILYEYFMDDLIKSVTDSNGSMKYTYDNFGRIIQQTDYRGIVIDYTYDSSGNIAKIETIYGSISYSYDTDGHLTSVCDQDNHASFYTYDKVGNIIKTEYPNGIVTTYEYNDSNCLIKQISENQDGTILASYEYSRGATGEILSCQELTRKVYYTYDDLGRLTSEIIEINGHTSVTEYIYDLNSNRIAMNKNGNLITYSYNELNQLVRAGTVIYSYDDAGNLVAKSDNGILKASFEYNSRNQMIKSKVFSENDMVEETYSYNYLGDRISKTSNGITTYYILDYSSGLAQNLVVLDGSDSFSCVRGLNLISMKSADGLLYYLYDGQNSVRILANGDGELCNSYTFDSYGNTLERTGIAQNEYGFQGELQDETGLIYLRSRYLDPTTGVFTSMDTYEGTLTEPLSKNLYLFANSNPVKFSDPSGHSACEFELETQAGKCAIIDMLAKALNTENLIKGFCVAIVLMSDIYAMQLNKQYVETAITADIGVTCDDAGSIVVGKALPKSLEDYKEAVKEKLEIALEKIKIREKAFPSIKHNHHIVAKGAWRAEPARSYMVKVGITKRNNPKVANTEIPENKVMLKMSMHSYLHSVPYYEWVNYALEIVHKKTDNELVNKRLVIAQILDLKAALLDMEQAFP